MKVVNSEIIMTASHYASSIDTWLFTLNLKVGLVPLPQLNFVSVSPVIEATYSIIPMEVQATSD